MVNVHMDQIEIYWFHDFKMSTKLVFIMYINMYIIPLFNLKTDLK